ncbi:regulator of telomere elongation helicase 1-like [Clytia hemisphaerica]|uniref:Regulator of telomere elongation helicase 1 homolog n=2 Tax=Clytia hemisphaerica TaxID=252671 RepID=A0A7M5WL49_9CNID|eukprot:TCONS_00020675-protein
MVNVDICGIDVDFPFEPYDCQKKYMEKVIQCLQKGFNGVLESPTGTGKTLCLLCATLAWRETYAARLQLERVGTIKNKAFEQELGSLLNDAAGGLNPEGSWTRGFADIPKIIYASRTHSQISQAVSELKNTRYTPKICVLGSRDQMCINSEVMKEENHNGKVHMCRSKVSNKTCFYYNNIEASKTVIPNEIMDIEDLVNLGNEKRFCPYYMSRELRKEADLIFMPYNYVLDFKARSAHSIDLTNTIILLDEAHNVEGVCESNASFDLTSFDLASCIEDCQQCVELLMQAEEDNTVLDEASVTDLTAEDASHMKSIFLKIETMILNVPLKDGSATKSATFLFDELSKLKVNEQSKDQILDSLDKITGVLTGTKSKAFKGKNYALDKFGTVLRTMFSRSTDADISKSNNDLSTTRKFYKVHIQVEKKKEEKSKQKTVNVWTSSKYTTGSDSARTLSYWCFNPGLTMRDLMDQGVRSLILTSGTLSPIPSFKYELQVPFNVELENDHVIKQHQVFVGIIPQGPDGKKLNSSYKFRSTPEYQLSLGNTVVNLSRIIPHGLLVFFPSYPVMDMVIAKWQEAGIWNRLSQSKGLFIEPRRKQGLSDTMEEFYQKVQDPSLKGAIFFAVCRGKVSEGLDFADSNGRGVIITGLPFPPSHDPKVVLKMQYLDEQKEGVCIKGREWYKQQASRAVNQAIGRVIRHRNDYGAILLCDERFKYADSKAHLPTWIKKQIREYKDFGQAQRDLVFFFKDIPSKMGLLEPCGKQKRKHDDIQTASGNTDNCGNNDDCCMNQKPKLPRFNKSTNNTSNSFFGNLPNKAGQHQGSASTSLMLLSDQKEGKSSIFDSLNTTSTTNNNNRAVTANKNNTYFSTLQTSSTNLSTGATTNSTVVKTKKYKIVGNKPKDGASKVTKTTSVTVPETVTDAKQYLRKVKTVLDHGRYEKFGHALKLYKESGNIKILLDKLKDLLDRENLEHVSILKGFSCFVRKENDKKMFVETCKNFTGAQCVICLKEAYRPYTIATCSHMACYPCWYALKKEEELSCPKCGVEFSWKNLQKCFMEGQVGLYGVDITQFKL